MIAQGAMGGRSTTVESRGALNREKGEEKLSELAFKKQLSRIKNAIIAHLQNTGYKIIRCSNDPVCAIGARKKEWRCIVGHLRNIPYKIVKELENLPCPDNKVITKHTSLPHKA